MSDDTIDVQLRFTLDAKGATDAARAIAGVEKAAVAASRSAASNAVAIAKLDAAQARSAQSAAKLAAEEAKAAAAGQKVAQSLNQTAVSAERAAQAQQKTAQETAKTANEQNKAAISAIRLATAQEKASKPPSKGLGAYFQDIKNDAIGAAAGVVGFTAVLGAAQATAQSFANAIDFKANLDANTASINIQLKGVRDTGQVWNEAAAYAEKYKLTQAQTTATVQASVGILRQSKASIEDTFGVLQRLTVLAPGKTIEDAAFSVRELASGDITSIAEQFNISRQQAYEMRDAIASGADVVQVLSGYLDNAGVSMDTLKVQTEGVLGAQKDLAIAQEQLALAQAEFAQGPGLDILQAQIALTGDATRLLQGDFTALGDAINNSGLGAINPFIGAIGNYNNWVIEAGTNTLRWAGALPPATQATQQQAAATVQAGAAYVGYVTAAREATTATQAAQAATEAESQKKQLNAVETQILAAENAKLAGQAQLTASNIMAAGGNIQAEAARLAASSSFIDQLTAAYLRLAMAQQSAGQKRIAGQAANTVTYANPTAGSPGKRGTGDVDAVVRLQKANSDAAKAQIDQERAIASAKGDTIGQIKIEEAELAKLVPGTAPYIEQQTRIIQLQSQRAGGAAKAGAAAVGAEQKTSGAIVQIAQDTAEKLAAIDERVANERMKNAEKLAQSLRETALSSEFSRQADDLDLIGKDMSEDEINKLADREKAQAEARLSQIESVKEAQRVAEEEGAEVAQATFDARQTQIDQQQELDQKYYEKQRELAGDPALLGILETQYQEATAINSAQAADQIATAQAVAAAKAQALADEKQAVLGAAAEQATALGSTGKAASTAESRVADLSRALSSLPKNVATTITINEVKTGSSTGGGASSAGSSSSTPPPAASAPPKASANRVGAASSGRVSTQGIVEDAAAAAIGTLQGGTTPVLPTTGGGGSSGGGGGGSAASSGDPADQLKAIQDAIKTLEAIADLREKLADVGPPIDMALVQTLSKEAFASSQALGALFVQLTKEQGEAFSTFTGALSDAIGVLSDAASLRNDLVELGPPINQETVNALAAEAFQASQALGRLFVLLSEEQGENFELFTDALSNAMGPLQDAASLRKELLEIGPPLDTFTIMGLAGDARLALQLTQAQLIPLSEEQATALERFTNVEGAAIGVLSDMASLSKDLVEPTPPVSAEYLQQLAQAAQQATIAVQGTLLPTTEGQADALSRYADAAGSSVSALSSVAGLTQDLFGNYQSPTNEQIALLATDAQRITAAFEQSARTIEQSDGAKAWADAVGATFQAASAGLETIDRINLTQVALDPAQLATYQQSALAIMDTAQILGARAAQIPASDIAAWQNVTTAMNGQAELMINLAAVPFGNLPQIAGSFAGGAGGGGAPITVINNIYQLPGENTNALADRVINRLGQRFGDRR